MTRRIGRGVFILLCGIVAAILGTASALLWSPPGRRVLARLVAEESPRLVRGSLVIGGVSGRFTDGFVLTNVVLRDTAGVLLAEIPRLTLRYRLADLLAGRIVMSEAELERPVIQIIKHRRGGRLNYEEILRLNEGPGGGGPSPLIELRSLIVRGGELTIRLPWNPDGRLRTAAQRDSALAAERARPGRRIEEGREGLEIVRVISGLETEMPLVRLATPTGEPVTLRIDRLAARVSDPAITIRDLAGVVRTKGDSLLFELERAAMPGTEARGAGRIDWPQDTLQYRFAFDAPRVALADLRWVSPDFPAFTGRARLRATSVSNRRTEWDIHELAVGDAESRVTGRLVAITDLHRGLGFRRLALDLGNLDLEVVRPYLDTLPVQGRLDGHLDADGFFDGMTVSLDWRFRDARVPEGNESALALQGLVRLGGPDGMVFEAAELPAADLDLRTVRLMAPAVILPGRLGLSGQLDGPWRNVTFDGEAVHQEAGRPATRLRGRTRLDTRGEILGLDADLALDSLVFDGIRTAFPRLAARGALGGRVRLAGYLDRLAVEADVRGALGQVVARGGVILTPPRWGADSLLLTFERLDLAALLGSGPGTSLRGTLLATGVMDSAVPPEGRLRLALGAGRVREVRFDSALARLRVEAGMVQVDTVAMHWPDGAVGGAGRLGWRAPDSGEVALAAEFRDLVAFDSLALALLAITRDTALGGSPLGGRARLGATVRGAMDRFVVTGGGVVEGGRFQGYRVHALEGEASFASADSALVATFVVDTLEVGGLAFNRIAGGVAGRPDSIAFRGDLTGKRFAEAAVEGDLVREPEGRHLHLERFDLSLLGREWRLAFPADARLLDSAIVLDTVRIETADGSGSLELAGSIPGRREGALQVTALGIALQDLYGLAQRDTTALAGTLALDARVGGTAASPALRGAATISGAVFRDFRSPLMRGAFDYAERRLRSDLTFWRTGKPVVQVTADLPVDLAFRRTPRRQLPGPITIVARGDSVDLAIAEAFTPNLRRVTGRLDVDARVEGTWDQPRLAGSARVVDGALTVPGLGVRYGPITGSVRLAGDSIRSDDISIGSDPGDLAIRGGIRLERLNRPVLDLALDATNFQLIDVENYLQLRAWGNVRLTGPLARPVLTGSGSLSNSAIYFADLVSKDIINLEDPLLADLVDTLVLREQNLRATFQSRFLDSLSIRDLEFRVGDLVWLRSNEANIQLEGRVRVNKTRREYRIDGTLDTPRGTYTLKLPGIVRTFNVERGTVRYFGDLDADVDIRARHEVKTPGSAGDVSVIANITGSLFAPKLALEAGPERPGLSEQELISLLAVGTTDISAASAGSQEQILYSVLAYISSALSSEITRSAVSDSDDPLFDIIEIRPPFAVAGQRGGTGTTQFSLGRALTSKLFLIANAGFCVGGAQASFGARNLGASIEYRFRRELRFLIAAEPVATCGNQSAILTTQRRYQFGAELRWDRDY